MSTILRQEKDDVFVYPGKERGPKLYGLPSGEDPDPGPDIPVEPFIYWYNIDTSMVGVSEYDENGFSDLYSGNAGVSFVGDEKIIVLPNKNFVLQKVNIGSTEDLMLFDQQCNFLNQQSVSTFSLNVHIASTLDLEGNVYVPHIDGFEDGYPVKLSGNDLSIITNFENPRDPGSSPGEGIGATYLDMLAIPGFLIGLVGYGTSTEIGFVIIKWDLATGEIVDQKIVIHEYGGSFDGPGAAKLVILPNNKFCVYDIQGSGSSGNDTYLTVYDFDLNELEQYHNVVINTEDEGVPFIAASLEGDLLHVALVKDDIDVFDFSSVNSFGALINGGNSVYLNPDGYIFVGHGSQTTGVGPTPYGRWIVYQLSNQSLIWDESVTDRLSPFAHYENWQLHYFYGGQ